MSSCLVFFSVEGIFDHVSCLGAYETSWMVKCFTNKISLIYKHYVCVGASQLLFTENWDLKNDEWKQDVIPEIWSGRNIADYIDPEIMEVGEYIL